MSRSCPLDVQAMMCLRAPSGVATGWRRDEPRLTETIHPLSARFAPISSEFPDRPRPAETSFLQLLIPRSKVRVLHGPFVPRPLRFPLGGAAFGRVLGRALVSRARRVGRGGAYSRTPPEEGGSRGNHGFFRVVPTLAPQKAQLALPPAACMLRYRDGLDGRTPGARAAVSAVRGSRTAF